MDRQKFVRRIMRTEFDVIELNEMKAKAKTRLDTYPKMTKDAAGRGDTKLVQQLAEYHTQTETEIGIINDLLQYVKNVNVLGALQDDAGLKIINHLLNYAKNMVDADRTLKHSVDAITDLTVEPNELDESDGIVELDESDESDDAPLSASQA